MVFYTHFSKFNEKKSNTCGRTFLFIIYTDFVVAADSLSYLGIKILKMIFEEEINKICRMRGLLRHGQLECI